jgi:hypothetical protein
MLFESVRPPLSFQTIRPSIPKWASALLFLFYRNECLR